MKINDPEDYLRQFRLKSPSPEMKTRILAEAVTLMTGSREEPESPLFQPRSRQLLKFFWISAAAVLVLIAAVGIFTGQNPVTAPTPDKTVSTDMKILFRQSGLSLKHLEIYSLYRKEKTDKSLNHFLRRFQQSSKI